MTNHSNHGKRVGRMSGVLLALHVASLLGCCSNSQYCLTDRSCVSQAVQCRFSKSVGDPSCPEQIVYPYGITLEQELEEDQAVALALWNNAAFLELLADLGMAQGDLVQAGLLPNPEVAYFFPVTDKPFKYLLDFPLESIWLRPIRVVAAEREYDRVCHRLTQSAIDLIRDTRQGYADLQLAHSRTDVASFVVKVRAEIAKIAKSRLDAGDISPQEASTALIDQSRAEQELTRVGFDIAFAEERLRNLMGVSNNRTPLKISKRRLTFPQTVEVDQLSAEAVLSRPDLLAAEEFSAAAAERLRIAKIGWVRLLGILDATSGVNGHEFGPAGRLTLPIFNWNQGAIARAEAELEKAERQQRTVHNQIIQDVHQSFTRFSQGQAELAILNEQVLPQVEKAILQTEKAYRGGDTNYAVVLQSTQQLIDSRFREVQLQADLRRAWAELERSVGRHLGDAVIAEPAVLNPEPLAPSRTQEAGGDFPSDPK